MLLGALLNGAREVTDLAQERQDSALGFRQLGLVARGLLLALLTTSGVCYMRRCVEMSALSEKRGLSHAISPVAKLDLRMARLSSVLRPLLSSVLIDSLIC